MKNAVGRLMSRLDSAPAAARAGIAFALSMAVWTAPSHFAHFAVCVCLFLVALTADRSRFKAWRSPAGMAWLILVAVPLALLPASVSPAASARALLKVLPQTLAAIAIPVVFFTPRRLAGAMVAGAWAVTSYLAVDLARLAVQLGPGLMAEARFARPYVMNHPNVASIMAAAALLVLSASTVEPGRRPAARTACAAGAALNLLYLMVLASRGPQIAFAASVAAAGVILPTRRQKLLWCLLLAAAVSAAVANISLINPRFGDGDVSSLNERSVVWSHTMDLALRRPVLGHGYGKKLFQDVYYASNPPPASFVFPHAHQYWIKAFFELGCVGVALRMALWFTVSSLLLRHISRQTGFGDRLWPGVTWCIAVLLLVYGLGDFPDNLAYVLQLWLPAVAIGITADRKGT
ncbi:MAG: O-antigen ligase family protein [Lentisphaerae bacterium]|nr:O-antigen ligase family protein [Lentisphaerota bacterium]